MAMKRLKKFYDKPLLVFVHIPKAGGTTLIHLLRHNYFMSYCDVRPLRPRSQEFFCAEDMKTFLKMNPFIECIGGHSIRQYGDLDALFPNVRYITILRNPVNRCISHYQQRVTKFGNISFEEFLTRDWVRNLQTRHIAGSDDVQLAKKILTEKFFSVGILEEFDQFLTILLKKLSPKPFDPSYRIMRVAGDKNAKEEILRKHEDLIIDTHRADIELYNYVKQEILASERKMYGPDIEKDILDLRHRNEATAPAMTKQRIDFLFRKLYYEPISGLIRASNGLPSGTH